MTKKDHYIWWQTSDEHFGSKRNHSAASKGGKVCQNKSGKTKEKRKDWSTCRTEKKKKEERCPEEPRFCFYWRERRMAEDVRIKWRIGWNRVDGKRQWVEVCAWARVCNRHVSVWVSTCTTVCILFLAQTLGWTSIMKLFPSLGPVYSP